MYYWQCLVFTATLANANDAQYLSTLAATRAVDGYHLLLSRCSDGEADGSQHDHNEYSCATSLVRREQELLCTQAKCTRRPRTVNHIEVTAMSATAMSLLVAIVAGAAIALQFAHNIAV